MLTICYFCSTISDIGDEEGNVCSNCFEEVCTHEGCWNNELNLCTACEEGLTDELEDLESRLFELREKLRR